MSAARRQWDEKAQQYRERSARFETDSQIEIARLYTPDEAPTTDPRYYQEKLGFPGEYPFTRGVYPTMYRGRLWTMRQYAGFGSAEETNARYKYLIAQGQTGLSVAFDLPTQIGYDSDHPKAEGEVGKAGVAISSLKDFEILFGGISLENVSVSMTINATAALLLAMHIAVAERQGLAKEKLSGTTQNDILKEYIARKTYIFPPEFSMRLVTDIIAYCAEHMPRWNPISISGYHMREAGATAVQELAFALANGIEYVNAVRARGLDIDRFASQLSFFFSCDNNFFEEIAKFRAARRLWAKIMRERFGAKKKESLMLRFHTQTAGSSLTAQQPLNNIIRTALQALAAVLGGTQSLHTNSYDEALALPTEEAVRIALRTQQIIAEESGVADTIDPVGGSYYVEWLTDRLEEAAQQYIEKIDELGGMRRAIELGFVQREIEQSAYRKQREIEEKKRLVVGVNIFASEEPQQPKILKIAPEVIEKQLARLREIRRTRDAARVKQALENLRAAARTDKNLMPFILEAVKAYATVGEICDLLREEFGEYQERPIV
uniref:methylmalonyl-CoA mutase n=1 Tax=Acetithermum autotrophicum TaxID=1446466 RepID=H5SRR6_ACEAU|nr:methylmalonyl-CoA mutase, N-terminal domain [Candidatus Acetothermum autotrophicum]